MKSRFPPALRDSNKSGNQVDSAKEFGDKTKLTKPKTMKSLINSFTSFPNNGTNITQENSSSNNNNKENTIGSTTSNTNDREGPANPSIISIANRAVALNFPSSYIRAVPINPREVNRDNFPQPPGNEHRASGGTVIPTKADEAIDCGKTMEDIDKYAVENQKLGLLHAKSIVNDGIHLERNTKKPISKPMIRQEATTTTIVTDLEPSRSTNPYVSSPLSDYSGALSPNGSSDEDSSLSIARSSDEGSSKDDVAFLPKSNFRPPKEVITVTSNPIPAKNSSQKTAKIRKQGTMPENKTAGSSDNLEENGNHISYGLRNRIRNINDEDDEKRTAEELTVKLVGDLERMREENEKCVSKNRRLEAKLQILKAQQDEHMIHRGRLIKACLYTAPVFALCGGLDVFLATILLVWVLVEVESYLDGNESNDVGNEDNESEQGSDGDSNGSDESFGDDGSSLSL